jgi:aminoglycoside phosphotransferase (APT) family kinase protein
MIRLSKQKIQEIFNKWSLGRVKTKRLLKGGVVNPVYLINDKIILRIRSDSNEFKFEKEQFLFNLLKKRTDLPVPEVIKVDSSRKIIHQDYIVMKKLPGKLLKMDFHTLSENQKKKIISSLGKSLAKIHSIHFKEAGEFINGKFVKKNWEKFIWEIYTNSLKKVKKYNALDKKIINKIEKFIPKNKELLSIKFQPSLLHADFNTSNILIQNGKVSGIFDMEWSSVGHTEWELCPLSLKFMEKIHPYEKYFFQGYDSKIKREKEKRYHPFYGIIYWMMIICWIYDEKAKVSPNRFIKEIKHLLHSIEIN